MYSKQINILMVVSPTLLSTNVLFRICFTFYVLRRKWIVSRVRVCNYMATPSHDDCAIDAVLNITAAPWHRHPHGHQSRRLNLWLVIWVTWCWLLPSDWSHCPGLVFNMSRQGKCSPGDESITMKYYLVPQIHFDFHCPKMFSFSNEHENKSLIIDLELWVWRNSGNVLDNVMECFFPGSSTLTNRDKFNHLFEWNEWSVTTRNDTMNC